MGKGDRITVKGADTVAKTLHGLADDIQSMPKADQAAGELVQQSAQSYARRRTGAMRASIRVERAEHGATVTAGVGISSPYPAVQEYGSRRRHITPNYYMKQAAETQETGVVTVYETAVNKAVGKVKGA